MFNPASFTTAVQFIRTMGGQVAMSVVVSVGVAGVLSVPALLFPKGPAEQAAVARADKSQDSVWHSAVAADGKIRDRHMAAADGEAVDALHGGGLIMPAALVMPMSAGWPQPVFIERAVMVEQVQEKAVRASLAEVVPTRKPSQIAERPKLVSSPAPGFIPAPAAASVATAAIEPSAPPPEPTLLARVVYQPVAQAANVVTSAAGMVGSAGSWTVSQATSLLPRW